MDKDLFNHCLKRIHDGDIEGMRAIYDEYYEKCKTEAKYMFHDEMKADDAASKTMLNIVKYAQSSPNPHVEHAGAYMRRTVRNVVFEMMRKDKKEADIDSQEVADMADENNFENSTLLKMEIEKLPEIDFKIVTGFYFYGLSVIEIAETVGKAESTVKEHLSQIRKTLAKNLSER